MTWDDLLTELAVTPDDKGWLHVTRQSGPTPRVYVIQRVTIGDWELALLQTTIASEVQLGAAEAATRLLRFPLGALVFNEGFWVLRQALSLEGLALARLELTLRCLDIQARELIPEAPPVGGTGLFKYYAE